MDKMSEDIAAWREPKPAPIHRIEQHSDPMAKSSLQSEGSEPSGPSTTVLATISEEGENKPGMRQDIKPTKIKSNPEAIREALSPKIRHARIRNGLATYHQRQKKEPIVEKDQKDDNQWLLEKTTASTGSSASNIRADTEVEQRGIMQSASETTEDCMRQTVKTVVSLKHKAVGEVEKHTIHTSSGQGSWLAALSHKIVADAE